MKEHELKGVEGVQDALSWVLPTLNDHTFVNGFKWETRKIPEEIPI